MSSMSLEVYGDKGGKSRWRLKSSNGQTIASSGESFSTPAAAKKAASGFSKGAGKWNYEVYANKAGKHSWRAKATNGQTVGSAGAAFASKSNAQRAANNIRGNAGGASGP